MQPVVDQLRPRYYYNAAMFLFNDIGLWVAIWILRVVLTIKLLLVGFLSFFWLLGKHLKANGIEGFDVFIIAWIRSMRKMFETYMR